MIFGRFLSRSKNISQVQIIWRNLSDYQRNVNISYTIYPDGNLVRNQPTPVFVLHGLFGSKSNWRSLAKRIALVTKRQVVTLDARNHGDSGHDPKINYFLMRDDLLRMMDVMGVEKPILLGHSMGGKTVMCFALSKPERVSSLIVVDTAPVFSPGGEKFKLYAQIMKDADISSISSLTEARNQVANKLKAVVSDVGIQQFLLTNLTQSENKTIAWRVNLDAIIDNVNDICSFPEFTCTYDRKVLFIGGSDSEHIHESTKPIIRKLFPTAVIEYISNAGHWVHADKPEEFLQTVKEFIHSTHGES